MAFLRLVLSALLGAGVAFLLFAGLGTATSPATIQADTLADFPHAKWVLEGGDRGRERSALWRGVSRSTDQTPNVTALKWDAPVLHPGFEDETVVDPIDLDPELEVMSRPISTAEALDERRWWQSIYHRAADE